MGNTERGFKITSEVIGRTMSFDLSNRKKKIATSKKTSNETCKNTSRSIIDFSKNNRSLLFLKNIHLRLLVLFENSLPL